MKKMIFTAALALLLSTVAQAQGLAYHIKGKLEGISPMPAKIYLLDGMGLTGKTLDSALVSGGQYSFNGTLSVDEAFGITLATKVKNTQRENQFILIIDKGEFEVNSVGSLANSIVKGSGIAANQQWEQLNRELKMVGDTLVQMRGSVAYQQDKELQAQVRKKGENALGAYISKLYHYAKNNPQSRISPFCNAVLFEMPYLSDAGRDTLISLLPERVKNGKLGEIILKNVRSKKAYTDSVARVTELKHRQAEDKIPLGLKAPDFSQNDPAGKPVSLASLRGKYVLIDFWASWCGPCRAENPNLVKAFQKYKDKGFTILGVSLDGKAGKTAWIDAIAQDGLTWTQVSNLEGFESSAAQLYSITRIPQNFLISPDGIVVAKNLRGDALEKKLAEVFGK